MVSSTVICTLLEMLRLHPLTRNTQIIFITFFFTNDKMNINSVTKHDA